MAPSKKYYWLRLKDNFFQQKEIKKLRKIAGGDTFTIIYLKMLLIAMKQDNKLYFEGVEEEFEEELALQLDEEIDNVKMTVAYLKAQNLIEQLSEEDYLLTKCNEMVGKETDSAERVRKHRQNKLNSNTNLLHCNNDVTERNTEIEIEKEIDIDNNNIVHLDAQLTPSKAPSKKDINDFFEQIWSLYPSKKGKANISDSKKKTLYKLGDEIKRAITRYIQYVEQKRNSGFPLEYKNGSTFFNNGYVDYLDSNYNPETVMTNNKKPNNSNKFHNFEQREYTAEEYKEVGKRNFDKNFQKLVSKNKFHNYEQRMGEYTAEELEAVGKKNLEEKLKKLGINQIPSDEDEINIKVNKILKTTIGG